MQYLKRQKLGVKLFEILTYTYSLKKVQEVEFLIFRIDAAKITINNKKLMTRNKNQNVLYN